MTINDFIGGFIKAHEGGLSMDPKDNGNWTGGHQGQGTLVGSKYGVTAGALAQYRKQPTWTISKEDIANLSFKEAVDIGVLLYYNTPKFNLLPWNRVTASVVDKGWGSGPKQSIKLLQRLLGVEADGVIGKNTVRVFNEYLNKWGEEDMAQRWANVRIHFDTGLNQPRFLKGWNNRTRSFLPGTPWWKEFTS